MAKRFTDTNKWKKRWIRQLDPKYKLFWFYLLDNCDHAGIYDADIESASFHIGINYTEDEILKKFNRKIIPFKNDKWFIPKFVEYQYGELNENNRAHLSVINILNKYKLNKDHVRTLQGDKDKVKEKVKNNRKPNNLDEVKVFFKEKNIQDVDPFKFYSFYEANGWVQGKNKPIKNWKMCVNTWRTGEQKEKKEITLICPNHHDIMKKTLDKNLFTFCSKCREKLIDKEKLNLEKVIKND